MRRSVLDFEKGEFIYLVDGVRYIAVWKCNNVYVNGVQLFGPPPKSNPVTADEPVIVCLYADRYKEVHGS